MNVCRLKTFFPCGSSAKESARSAADLGSILGLGRSPEEGKAYSLQYSGLENSIEHRQLSRRFLILCVCVRARVCVCLCVLRALTMRSIHFMKFSDLLHKLTNFIHIPPARVPWIHLSTLDFCMLDHLGFLLFVTGLFQGSSMFSHVEGFAII